MLAEIYITALLVDENLTDQDRELWDKGEINNDAASIAWLAIVSTNHLLILSGDDPE